MSYALNAVYAKIHCIYSRRLTDRNYNELLSQNSVSGVAEYLKSKTAYSEIFEGVPTTSELQRGQLQTLLYNKLYNDLTSVIRFQTAAGCDFYKYFIMKYDVDQITNFLSSLKTRSASYLFTFPVFYNERSNLDLYKPAQASDEDELLKCVEGTIYYDTLKNSLPKYRISENLMTVQADFYVFLDREFVKLTAGKKKKDISSKSELGKLYKTLNDVTLVKAVYRMRRFASLNSDGTYALPERLTLLSKKQFSEIINAPNKEALLEAVSKTYLSDMIPKNEAEFSQAADEYLYKIFSKAVRRTSDADAAVFAYVWLAENEIKNIIHIIEGIRYGMTPVEILPMLCGISHEQ
ncbi:MAG: V-type ATPase subunit [Clostridiales bacterium]|nr:V-type ATPase subunit [Clostridiales bacterium]